MENVHDLQTLIRMLVRYLRNNPQACDSQEGIRHWWLADPHAMTADELDKALNWMTHKKLVEQSVGADGRVRFRRIASDAELDAVTSGNGNMAGTS